MSSSAEIDFVHPSNVFVDEPLDEDNTEIVESNNHEVENSEYYVISDEESVSISAPPYSPVVSDVSVHANSDEDLNEIHEQFHQILIMLYLKYPLLKLNFQLC